MSIVASNALAGASGQAGAAAAGFQIDRSLRFNSADTSYLTRGISSAGNRKTWTWSSWIKIASISYQNLFGNLLNNNDGLYLYFYTDGKLYIHDYQLSGGANLSTTEVFRDHSAWYHFVIAYDTTQSTAADRVKLYVNGTQQTLSGTFPNQNIDGQWNKTQTQYIGKQSNNVSSYALDAYLAEVHFIDGQALAPTDFGEFDANNVWNPKQFEGTYNTAASFPSYPGVTISPSAVGGGSVSHVNGGGTYFYSQASSGAGSIKVEFSSPITGVTSIKYNGGGYSVNSAYNIKINGTCLLYTSPSPRDKRQSRMPSSA